MKKSIYYGFIILVIGLVISSSSFCFPYSVSNEEYISNFPPKSSQLEDFKTDPNTVDWGTSGTPDILVPDAERSPEKCEVISSFQDHSYPLELYRPPAGAPNYGVGRTGYLIDDATAVNTSIWVNSNDLTDRVVYFAIGDWPYEQFLGGICINDGIVRWYDAYGDYPTSFIANENEWNQIQLEWVKNLGYRAFWNNNSIFTGYKLISSTVNAQAVVLTVRGTTAFYDALVVTTTQVVDSSSDVTSSSTTDSTTTTTTDSTTTNPSETTSTTDSVSTNDGSSTLLIFGVIFGVVIVVAVGVSKSKRNAPRPSPRSTLARNEIRHSRPPYSRSPRVVGVPVPVPIPVPVFLEDTEKILLEKFKSILEISQEVEIARIARSLKISEDVLFEKMLRWNKAIPFKIRGKMVVVENMGNFMAALDNQFSDWDVKEDHQEGKI